MEHPGKISRLPRPIREQLNHRLENFEPGPRILKWLNSLPEVQAVLAAEFDSISVSKQNLSQWKKTGFRRWQLLRAAIEFATEDAPHLAPEPQSLSASISSSLSRWIAMRFAAAAHAFVPSDDDPLSEMRHLNELCASVTALRRGDLSAEHLLLEQKRLALLESASSEEREKLFWQWAKRPDIQEKLFPRQDRDALQREVERMINYKMLGIPYTSAPSPDEHLDPAILI
jgi:hypothetical protein